MKNNFSDWIKTDTEYNDYKFPNRLKLKNSLSPNKIEKLFFEVFNLLGYPRQSTCQIKDHRLSELLESLENDEVNREYEKIRKSMLCSFEFNQTKYNRYPHYLSERSIRQLKKSPSFYIYTHAFKVINFINLEELSEIRNLFLYLQNKNKFIDFTENRLAQILHYNFQTLNNNLGNSIENNRKRIRESRKNLDREHPSYYIEFKTIGKYMIDQYL